MPLWGIVDGTEDKPKYLKQEDKNNCVIKPHGLELQIPVGSRTRTETLVTVGSQTNPPLQFRSNNICSTL